MKVHVVRTGVANLASVFAAIERAGGAPTFAEDAATVTAAEALVLPGVGAFGAAMDSLHELGLVDALRARLQAGRRTLAICLGMQLLFEESDEAPGVKGLGVVPGRVVKLSGDVRVPQLGWNWVLPDSPSGVLTPGLAYFANSYRAEAAPRDWSVARTPYGESFPSAIARDEVLACQFHPELSGEYGQGLVRRWLAGGARDDARRRRVIPCLDVRDGRVVKGVKFMNLRDAGSPGELAGAYEAQGADEIVVLDVSASTEARRTRLATVREVRARLAIPLTVGGGVRSLDDAAALLEAGADKVSMNTAAVQRPDLVSEIASRFGTQGAVLAIDATERADGGWEVLTLSGRERTGLDAIAWAREAESRGAGELLVTSLDRDGTHSGYDLPLLRAMSDAVRIPVIASGGAGTPEHLVDALRAGADAVLAASIFHDGQQTVGTVKRVLSSHGIEVRP